MTLIQNVIKKCANCTAILFDKLDEGEETSLDWSIRNVLRVTL